MKLIAAGPNTKKNADFSFNQSGSRGSDGSHFSQSQPLKATFRGRRAKDSLAALMKLLWYWYVIRGAGSILETHRRDAGKSQER